MHEIKVSWQPQKANMPKKSGQPHGTHRRG
jgi:hypothetical protein